MAWFNASCFFTSSFFNPFHELDHLVVRKSFKKGRRHAERTWRYNCQAFCIPFSPRSLTPGLQHAALSVFMSLIVLLQRVPADVFVQNAATSSDSAVCCPVILSIWGCRHPYSSSLVNLPFVFFFYFLLLLCLRHSFFFLPPSISSLVGSLHVVWIIAFPRL